MIFLLTNTRVLVNKQTKVFEWWSKNLKICLDNERLQILKTNLVLEKRKPHWHTDIEMVDSIIMEVSSNFPARHEL